MANVPYNPTPTVEPTSGGSGATYGSVPEASPNAFGAQIGGAEQGFGEQVDKLRGRFQNIYAESTARDATTQTATQMADAESRFHQLKGNDAVAGLKPFQDEINTIAKNNGDGLSINANEMYQRDSASLVNNAVFRAGAHAGEQADEAQKTSLNASIATNVNQFAMNATNPTGASYLKKIQDDALSYAHFMGVTDPNVADQMVSHNYGEAYAAAIKTNLQSNPDVAKQLWDQASNGVITKPDGSTVPYLDATHRGQISSEMEGEFRRQFGEQLQTARMYAMSGVPYNKDAFAAAAKNAGFNEDYINAETTRLDQLGSKAGVVNTRYGVEKSLEDARAQAASGLPITNIPSPEAVKAAYPNEPQKANDVLNEFKDQQHIAGFVGALPTMPMSQIGQNLDKFKPTTAPVMSIADSIHQQESGGRIVVPGSGPSVGGWQITPATFQQYAKPGEDINNSKDNEAVGRRIIDDYTAKYNGDNARIATAYFSGPGNVAPIGSPTPWLRDTKDENGKSVSSYVADVTGRVQGSGFAEQSKLYGKMQTATANYLKNLSDDPAGVISGTDPNLTNLLDAGTKDPTKIGPYIDAMNARQKLLEIPEANRAVLPTQIATQWASTITSNPTAAPDTISQLEQKTGSYWPQVYHSLVTQGNLPSSYQAIAHLNDDPGTKADAYQLAKWMGDDDAKNKDTSSLVGGAKSEADIKKNISSNPAVQDLMESLARSGQSRSQIEGTVNAINSLAFAKTLYNRDPDAAQHAVDAFTKKYQFMTSGNARVPSQYYDAVNMNAQGLLENLQSNGAVVPTIYNDAIHGTVMKPKNYYAWVQNSPTWVTSPTEDALWLKDPQDGWVRDKTGQPISVPFNKPAPSVMPETILNKADERESD